LVDRNRRALRIHLVSDVTAGLGTLQRAITAALEEPEAEGRRRRQRAANPVIPTSR